MQYPEFKVSNTAWSDYFLNDTYIYLKLHLTYKNKKICEILIFRSVALLLDCENGMSLEKNLKIGKNRNFLKSLSCWFCIFKPWQFFLLHLECRISKFSAHHPPTKTPYMLRPSIAMDVNLLYCFIIWVFV